MALTRIKTDQITDGEVKSADLDTDITLSGDLNVADITMTGELNGPATFYIDPAPHDPDTDGATNGLVVIRGNLQIDGTTTTINSSTLTVDDKNVVLASGAANVAAASGAGIQVDISGVTNPELAWYAGAVDTGVPGWEFNYPVVITQSGSGRTTNLHLVNETSEDATEIALEMSVVNPGNDACDVRLVAKRDGANTGSDFYIEVTNSSGTITKPFYIKETGLVGIGTDDPTATLYVKTSTNDDVGYFENTTASGNTKLTIHNNKAGDAAALVLRGERVSSGVDSGQLLYQNGTNVIANIRGMAKDGGSSTFDGGELFFYTSAPGTGSSVSLAMAIDQDGKVGIGKQIPEDKLHVNGSLQFGDLVAPAKATTTVGSGPDYNLAVGINQDNTNTSFDQIWGEWQSTASDSYFAIKRRSAGDTGTPSNRFHLRGSDGWIGVGTSLPETLLHLQKVSSATYSASMSGGASYTPSGGDILQIRNSNNNVDDMFAGIWFETGIPASNSTGSDRSGRIAYLVENNAGYGGHFVFQTRGTNAILAERLRIQQNGNIGIGITDPQYQLHVKGAGDIKIEDEAGGSAHLRIGATTAGVRDSEWKVKVSGSLDEFHIDHDYTAGGVSVGETAFKLGSNHSIYNKNDQPTVRPSFMVDFINSGEVLDHRLVYHRSGVGTRVNSAGDIEYMRDGVPRFDYDPITLEPKGILIERSSYNGLTGDTNGTNFRASTAAHLWDVSSSKLGFSERAPDGTMSAALVRTSSNGDRVNATGVASVGGYISWSVFLKQPSVNPATSTVLLLYNNTTSSQLGNAIITWGATPTISGGGIVTKHKDGWWRFGFVSNAQVSQGDTVTGYTYINGSGSYNQHGLYVWGGQLEPLNTMADSAMISSFIPNDYEFGERESAGTYQDENGIIRLAAPNQPRYGYRYHADSKKFLPTGLIAETASTNRMPNTYMGLLTSGWSQSQNIAITDYQATAPDGTKTASTFIPNAQTSAHSTFRLTNASTGATCSSIFLKAKGITTGFIYVDTVGGHSGILWFDLSNGNYEYDNGFLTNSTIEGYGVEDYGNGWYRPWISCRHGTGQYYFHVNTSGSFAGDSTHTPNGTDGFYAWGAQVEDQTAPTSFIYTSSGQAVTRAKDNMFVGSQERGQDILYADLNKNGWYNQNNLGTIMVDFEGMAGSNPDGRVFGLTRGYGGDERIDYVMSTGAFQPYVATNSVAQVSISNIDITDGVHSVALSFGKDHFRTVVDGGSVVNDMGGDMPDLTPGYLSIGQNSIDSTNFTKARFRKVAYWPVQLSDDEKKAITED